jgi:hypothetical protein
MSEPLDRVLTRYGGEFVPEHPERAPWHQPTIRTVEVAVTDNRATVDLAIADRVHLRGLDRPTFERDDLEPFDWTPAGWGVAP